MKPDRYNCRHDYEQELDGEAQRAAHDAGDCDGAPRCDWCVAERKTRHAAYMRKFYASRTGYKSWQHMKARCTNPNHPKWPIYGGRGITICTEWSESYEAFINHIGRRPGPNFTVDRIDNSRGYEPGNVRWATPLQQGHNKRNNQLINFRGDLLVIAEVARRLGVSRCCIQKRISTGRTIDQPSRTKNYPKRKPQ